MLEEGQHYLSILSTENDITNHCQIKRRSKNMQPKYLGKEKYCRSLVRTSFIIL